MLEDLRVSGELPDHLIDSLEEVQQGRAEARYDLDYSCHHHNQHSHHHHYCPHFVTSTTAILNTTTKKWVYS